MYAWCALSSLPICSTSSALSRSLIIGRASRSRSSSRAEHTARSRSSSERRQHLVAEGRPRLQRPSIEPPIGERDGREIRHGIDPQERPGSAEVTEGSRAVLSPIQCGVLAPWISNPRPQSQGSKRPMPGTTPTSPERRRWWPCACVAFETSVGRWSSVASATRSVQRSVETVGRPLEQARAGHSERDQDPARRGRSRTTLGPVSATSAPRVSKAVFE